MAESSSATKGETASAGQASQVDRRDLRNAFGTFMTGVTVITTTDRDGTPRGFTVNSFASVSLDPPLLLVCIDKSAASCHLFANGDGFAVNILCETQKHVSNTFATKRPDKFDGLDWHPGPAGHPILPGVAAWFDCTRVKSVEAGDHIVLIGQVQGYHHTSAKPLGYARGGYFTLGLEHEAANVTAADGRSVVGAIVEVDGKVLLVRDEAAGGYGLPEVGRTGRSGTTLRLKERLRSLGLDAAFSFVFAVFEGPESHSQFIYYRGQAELTDGSAPGLFEPSGIPWELISDTSTRAMLKRYFAERELGSFGIYTGDTRLGEVRPLAVSASPT